MELLMLIAGIVLLWKFSSTLNALAISAKSKTEIISEKVISECVQERTENFETFKKNMNGKQVYSHEEIMDYLKVK